MATLTLSTGEIVRTLRLRRKLSGEELAAMLGVHVATISRIENGQVRIRVDYLPKLASILQTDVDTLLGIDGPA